MPQQNLPSVEVLRERMRQAAARPLVQNTFYRDATVASYVINGTGPLFGLNLGARYSPAGAFPVLYFAADRLLAQLEVTHHINRLLPTDPTAQIRELHSALTSLQVDNLHNLLIEMACSDQGYELNASITEFMRVPIVRSIFEQDPALLQVYLEQSQRLSTPLRSSMDKSRISIAVRVTARGVLDLADPKTLEILQIDSSDLVLPTDSWAAPATSTLPLTHRLGLAAWDAPGIDGILVPTALPAQALSSLVNYPVNLVLFMHEKDPHQPRSTSVQIEIEDEFVDMTKLFWTHRPQWLLSALEEHEPELAKVLKRIAR